MQELLFSLIGGAIALGVPWLFKTFLPNWQAGRGDQQEHDQEQEAKDKAHWQEMEVKDKAHQRELEEIETESKIQAAVTKVLSSQQDRSAALAIAREAISWGREENDALRQELSRLRELYSQQNSRFLILTDLTRELRDEIRNEGRPQKRTRR